MSKIKQKHEARYLNGKPINWNKPPNPNKIVAWSKKDMYGRAIKGSFRTICHLNRLNNLSVKRFKTEIVVIQRDWNTGVAASAGTHDYDAVWDLYIPGVSWKAQQKFFRRNGLACWHRYPPLFSDHIHGFTLPPREGKDVSDDFKVAGFKVGQYVDGGYSLYGRRVTSSQIDSYYRHAVGLARQDGTGGDPTWFPPDISDTIFNLKRYVAKRSA